MPTRTTSAPAAGASGDAATATPIVAPTATPLPASQRPRWVVDAAVEILSRRFYEPLEAAALYREAYDGAAAALRTAGVTELPQAPLYPADAKRAGEMHADVFAKLEMLAEGRLPLPELTNAALRELARQRKDCHTFYVPASAVRVQRGTGRDETVTTGLSLSSGAPPRVTVVLPGSAAQQAGVLHGDMVIAINGQRTEQMTGGEAEALLDPQEGGQNTLLLRRPGGPDREVKLAAARLSLGTETHELLPDGIGLIRFHRFPSSLQLVDQLRQIFAEFEAQGVRGWIIDVRDNFGGAVTTAVAVASLFVEKGQLYRVLPRGTLDTAIVANGSAMATQRPLVFLVGPGSSSAAEIVPGALQALGRATLVGEPSEGCIAYARQFPLPDRSVLSVTEAEVRVGVTEQRLNGVGIKPDVVVARSGDTPASDPQVQAAAGVIESQLGRR